MNLSLSLTRTLRLCLAGWGGGEESCGEGGSRESQLETRERRKSVSLPKSGFYPLGNSLPLGRQPQQL